MFVYEGRIMPEMLRNTLGAEDDVMVQREVDFSLS